MSNREKSASIISELKNHELPWVSLAAHRAFPGDLNSQALTQKKRAVADHPLIRPIIEESLNWPGYPLKRHNDAKHIIQKIGFLSDIGLDREIPEIERISKKLLENTDSSGAFLSKIEIPKAFGGTNKPAWDWIICDFPLITESLIRFGFKDDAAVLASVKLIESLATKEGLLCRSSLPKFKGPGKRTEPCPIANLFALKVLGHYESNRNSEAADSAIKMLLDFWNKRTSKKYFMFGMGKRFKKLKYPFVWYDILHLADTLSLFQSVHNDPRFQEICGLIFSKEDAFGYYKPESVWMAYKGFDFGQKKEISPMLTLSVIRIVRRVGRV